MKKILVFLLGVSVLIFGGFIEAESTQKSLLEELSLEKNKIESLFDKNYSDIYNLFVSSASGFLSSIDYKGLMCLGVINDKTFLKSLQTENKNLKLNYLDKYSDLYADALDIEQKKHILDEKNISLFPSGFDYESEKNRILSGLIDLSNQQNILLNQFVVSYKGKINKFVEDFQDYSQKNKTLLEDLSIKIKSAMLIEESYNELMSDLVKYQSKLSGTGVNIFEKLPLIKDLTSLALDSNTQLVIDREVKRNKKLSNLEDELTIQKDKIIALYQKDFDNSIHSLLEKWYNNKELERLINDVKGFLSSYYIDSDLQCSKVLGNDEYLQESAQILANVKGFSINTLSGDSISSQFQSAIVKRIPLVIKIQEDADKNFKKIVQLTKQELLAQNQATDSKINDNNINSELYFPIGFQFSQPFTKGQSHPDIKILQELLNKLGYYFGAVDGIYSNQTLQAVYQYQLKNGLLKGYEKKPETRGWMGPSTRNMLNKDLLK